jgi:aminoglycoside phosphotransferase (APT) family kinase protein
MSTAELKDSIERVVSEHGPTATVESLERMAGGASRAIYELRLCFDGVLDDRVFVVRMGAEPGRFSSGGGDVDEFDLLNLADQFGVTVPQVHWRGEYDEAGSTRSYIVMDRVAGEAIARRLLRENCFATTRQVLPAQIAAEMARIHGIPLDEPRLESLDVRRREDKRKGFAVAEVGRYRALLGLAAGDHPMPVLTFTGRWLAQNAPDPDRITLVHGDFRIGNVMFGTTGLTAVLDWELAHIGDPVEDVAWFCVRAWRFGADGLGAGGLATREAFFEMYERESGVSLDRQAARYWEIFGNWKWAIICVLQAASYEVSGTPDVELAAIGRRVAETEREILFLMDQADGLRG